jgi:hypothetical protein
MTDEASLGDTLKKVFEGISAQMDALEAEQEEARDVADRFVAHANAIWNAAFPDDPNGWAYGAQLERCVIGKLTEQAKRIKELEAERDQLMQRLMAAQQESGAWYDSFPDEVHDLINPPDED